MSALFACAALPLAIPALLLVPAARPHARDLLPLVAAAMVGLAWLAAPLAADPRSFGLGRYLVDDALSRLFIFIEAVVFLSVALHVRYRVRATPALAQGLPRFAAWTGLFMASASLALICNHLVMGWALLEASALASAPLIRHGDGPGAWRAAWRYLLFSGVGLTMSLIGFECLAMGMRAQGGAGAVSFFVDELEPRLALGADVWRRLGLLFVTFGYGAKIGLAPMHAWVTETYDLSPPPVTALLSAVQTTTAFVVLGRCLQAFRHTDADLVSWELIGMGVLTMLVSTLRVVSARNVKRLVAGAAMLHNGIVAVGLGVGKLAAYGCVLYLASNALVKALLFLVVGLIVGRFRTKDTEALRGLVRRLPVAGAALMFGVFALLGFAPFGSFLGEVLILSGLMEGGHWAVFFALCLLLTIVMVATGRSTFPMIWGTPVGQPEPGQGASEPGELSPLAPKLPLALLLLTLGVYQPEAITALLRRVAAQLAGTP